MKKFIEVTAISPFDKKRKNLIKMAFPIRDIVIVAEVPDNEAAHCANRSIKPIIGLSYGKAIEITDSYANIVEKVTEAEQ